MKPIKIYFEKTDLGCWSYLQRSAGELPETPLYELLNWVLEQLNFQNFEAEYDRRGAVVSLTLGREAPNATEMDNAAEHAGRRLRAVNISGQMALFRETGITQSAADGARKVDQGVNEWGRRNTEFHYAFQLIKVLARLNKKTFSLQAPPIRGTAPDSVFSYLGECTRCWLYGFHGACVALSRACLEDAVRARLPLSQGPETLEDSINKAWECGLLDDGFRKLAHEVRRIGNKFLHQKAISETDSRNSLDALRGVLEHLFAS